MRIYIPLDDKGRYYILAELPSPKRYNGDYFFETDEWSLLYQRTKNTFLFQGVRNKLKPKLVRALKRRVKA